MDSRNGGPRLFRFLATWLTDERFGSFVNGSWNKRANFLEAVADFTKQTRQWNKEIFGNIIYRKRKLLTRIGGIQRILETSLIIALLNLKLNFRRRSKRFSLRKNYCGFRNP